MIFDFLKRKQKKEVKTQSSITGKRFAIRYKDLSTPIYYLSINPYLYDEYARSYHKMDFGELGELWTIVEVQEDGSYLDLVTGEVFIFQYRDESILDTVTPEYQEKAIRMLDYLLLKPLAVNEEVADRAKKEEVSLEIKKSILDDTMPKKEELILLIQNKRKEARERIKEYYDIKNKKQIDHLHQCALEEDKIRTEEAKKRLLEEKRRLAEEKKRQEEEALRREVEPRFESLFPRKIK